MPSPDTIDAAGLSKQITFYTIPYLDWNPQEVWFEQLQLYIVLCT